MEKGRLMDLVQAVTIHAFMKGRASPYSLTTVLTEIEGLVDSNLGEEKIYLTGRYSDNEVAIAIAAMGLKC